MYFCVKISYRKICQLLEVDWKHDSALSVSLCISRSKWKWIDENIYCKLSLVLSLLKELVWMDNLYLNSSVLELIRNLATIHAAEGCLFQRQWKTSTLPYLLENVKGGWKVTIFLKRSICYNAYSLRGYLC